MKDTDVWLRLMMSQKNSPFPVAATHSRPGSGSVATCHDGTCWLYNEGHCRFFGLCTFKHECSTCGGSHAAVQCPHASKVGAMQQAGDGKDTGELLLNVPVARPVPP